MAKPKVTISSAPGTSEEEIIYALEIPATERKKFRKKDITEEIKYIDEHTANLAARKVELSAILTEVNKL